MSNAKLIIGVVVGAAVGAAITAGIYSSKCASCAVPAEEVENEVAIIADDESSVPSAEVATLVLDSDKLKRSYAIGTDIGTQFATQQMDLDAAALGAGIADVINGGELQMSPEDLQATMTEMIQEQQAKMMAQQQEMQAKAAESALANKAAGEAFLEANKDKEGVVTLESGLQYKVISEGDGPIPTAENTVEVHYRGTLLDGTEFDSSYGRGEPVSFPVQGVIAGWTEALQLMKEGSKWELYIPSDLAYGERGAGADIGPGSTLTFEVELLKANVE